jgi:hypothetical protein
MILVGLILLSGMGIAGIKIWIERKNESQKESFTNQNLDSNNDL